jgi:hypothetical protein
VTEHTRKRILRALSGNCPATDALAGEGKFRTSGSKAATGWRSRSHSGAAEYQVNPASTVQGILRVLENSAYSVEDELARAQEALARQERIFAELNAELVRPFEKEERLTGLLKRQSEINAVLNVDKDAAETLGLDAEAA